MRGADRPPTDLTSIGSAALCIRLYKAAILHLLPLLALLLDPCQTGLPVELLLERALQFLEAALAEDTLFNPHL